MKKMTLIEIEGFKSIKSMRLELGDLNVVIGANGAGKSNLVSAFGLLRSIYLKDLQHYCIKSGGANKIFHFGSKLTNNIFLRVTFDQNYYSCDLKTTDVDSLFIDEELIGYCGSKSPDWHTRQVTRTAPESSLTSLTQTNPAYSISQYVIPAIRSWKVFHFEDTSSTAAMKKKSNINDNFELAHDAANLAPFLLRLKTAHNEYYQLILSLIQTIAPFIADFFPQDIPADVNDIGLQWRHKGSESVFEASQLSDGTLRLICLIVLLNQPVLPTTIIIDEPELGLHPAALNLLAGLLKSVSSKAQIIVSTQSVALLNQLSPEHIIVVDRETEQSKFRRLKPEEVQFWIEDYGIGDLWEKNLIGGRPDQ